MQEWLVIPYSHPAKLEDDNGRFNYRLSSVRIESEHAIGYLKGRFQSLRELRLQLNSEEYVVYSTLWIQACIILHCFCLDHELGNMQEDSLVRPPGLGLAEYFLFAKKYPAPPGGLE
jgi:hypothetical protein